jgi:UDP-N-acetylmuramoylalanine--D-glutamate ligase
MQLPSVTGKAYGVFGLGKTGLAAARALHKSGADVYAWDDGDNARSTIEKHMPGVRCVPIEEWPWQHLQALVLSPGVPLTHPEPHPVVRRAHANDVACIGDIELLYRANPNATYIAITGTNGKSTTTSLIAHILQQAGRTIQVGGNLGIAALALDALGEGGVYVLELSSYQLELVASTRFHVAVWLNISPDHLDRHGSMEHYIAAKRHIFDRQTESDTAVIGVDDVDSHAVAQAQMVKEVPRVIPIAAHASLREGVQFQDGVVTNLFAPDKTIDLRNSRTLAGAHNGQNAAAAYAACMAIGLSHEAIAAGMESFPGLAHRMQWLGEIGKVGFVNDSKATNADAAEKALQSYRNIYWICGGVPKSGGIAALGGCMDRVRHAYLIGDARDAFAKTLDAFGVTYTQCHTLDVAVEHAAHDAAASADEAVVLLSPACASFDQFPNFEARGDRFIQCYTKIKTGGGDAASA